MKTYQFITVAVLMAAIVGVMMYKGSKKKPCNCGGDHGATIIETEDGE